MSAGKEVRAHLKQHGLDDYIDKLLEAGYDMVSDLANASVGDLVAVGMKKPHAQRLIRSLSADADADASPAPSPSPAKPSSSSSSSTYPKNTSSSRPNPPFSSPPLEDVDVLIGVNKVDPKLVATVRKYDLLAKLGNVTSKPVQLVDGDHDTLKFTVKKEGTDLLRGIKNDIVVIACAGVFRSGKSYLLNRLFGSTSAFALGPNAYSETKGLWLWKGPTIEWDNGRKRTYVLMDCEGMGGVIAIDKSLPFPERLDNSNLKSVNPQYDARLFAISMLVSSYFMLNSKSVADNQTLDKLKGLAQLSRYVAPEVGKEGEFPRLLWVLRDVMLEIGPDADKYINGVVNDDKAQVSVQVLRDMFSKIGGFALPLPINNQNRIRKMEEVTIEQVRPQFNEFIELLQQRVFGEAQPKQRKSANGQSISRFTGEELAILLDKYVEAINAGKAPDISSVWESVALGKCREVGDEVVAKYKSAMEQAIAPKDEKKAALSTTAFSDLHVATCKKAITDFESNAPESDAKDDVYFEVFEVRIGGAVVEDDDDDEDDTKAGKGKKAEEPGTGGLFEFYRVENKKKSLRQCEKELEALLKTINSQIKLEKFNDLRSGLESLKDAFEQGEAAAKKKLDGQLRLSEALRHFAVRKAGVIATHCERLKVSEAERKAIAAELQAKEAEADRAAAVEKARNDKIAAEARFKEELARKDEQIRALRAALSGTGFGTESGGDDDTPGMSSDLPVGRSIGDCELQDGYIGPRWKGPRASDRIRVSAGKTYTQYRRANGSAKGGTK
jgi:hypothetical protein